MWSKFEELEISLVDSLVGIVIAGKNKNECKISVNSGTFRSLFEHKSKFISPTNRILDAFRKVEFWRISEIFDKNASLQPLGGR